MSHWLRSFLLILWWNVLSSRADLPIYFMVQTMLSVGVVTGLGFLLPTASPTEAMYLCTGSMTVSLITVGMVLAPQTVSYRRQSGFLDYQRSLPVPRTALMAADATVWTLLALPGFVLSMIVATLRFGLSYQVSPLVVPAVLLVVVSAVTIGYSIAYLVRPVLVNLITNAVIIVSLLFAPVNFPVERLPDWLAQVHRFLPFQYMAELIRQTVDVPPAGLSAAPFLVLAVWAIAGTAIACRVLSRRD